ncbi:recombinase family protein [Psychromicrobium sp. YIM B11713]|uniref:recombinase family protein n=1 Tax=Psychromicrobium sp. YIM B11713 TaxID=3145233 RepID=UPI00374F2C25
MTTAAIYARLSQDKRLGTDEEGKTVEAQIAECKDFILSKGWTIGKIYAENDISATSGAPRPKFEQLLIDAPKIVVAYRGSRLSRDVMDTLRLKTAKVTGYLTDGGLVDFSSADATMLTLIRSVIDAAEGEKKSEFQKLATLRDAKAGKYRGSIRPFGQDRKGNWIEPEASAVIEAAKKIASGEQSFYETAKIWNAAGLITPATGKQGGREWTSGTVNMFFQRPRLIGYQDYDGTRYPLKDWIPLLDEETFNQLQNLIASKRTGKRGVSTSRADTHLLTSIVRCGDCGRGMVVSYRGGKSNTKAYKCPTPKHQSTVAEPLENTVALHALNLLMHHDDLTAQSEEASQNLSALMDEKRVSQTAHDTWVREAAEAGLRPSVIAMRETEHSKRVAELDAEIFKINEDLRTSIFPAFSVLDPEQSNIERNLAGWREVNLKSRRDLLKSLFQAVNVSRAGQGKRFSVDRVRYEYTELGKELACRWSKAELEAMKPQVSKGRREGRDFMEGYTPPPPLT